MEWSVGKDPELIVDIWSTGALVAAVIEALMEDSEQLQRALNALRASTDGANATSA